MVRLSHIHCPLRIEGKKGNNGIGKNIRDRQTELEMPPKGFNQHIVTTLTMKAVMPNNIYHIHGMI